jgi:hypothetical protein
VAGGTLLVLDLEEMTDSTAGDPGARGGREPPIEVG